MNEPSIADLLVVKTIKALVFLEDGLYTFDAIEYQGQYWLVPEWIDIQKQGWSRPERIVRPKKQPFRLTPGGNQVSLPNPLPKAAFFGPILPQLAGDYEVVLNPPMCAETHSPGPVH